MNRLKLLGLVSGYSLWMITLYFLLTWVTFPWSRVEDQLAVASSDAGWALSVEDMSSAFFGVKAKGISLRPGEDTGEQPPAFASVLGDGIDIDRAQVKMPMSRLPTAGFLFVKGLASGKLALSEVIQSAEHIDLDAEFWNGSLAVDLETSNITKKIDLAIQDVNLDKYTINTPFVAANPQGTLRSKGNITWHQEDPKKSSGGIDLFLDSLTIPALPVLGDVAFSKSEAHVKLSRGRAEIRETSLEADEIQAIVEGFITLSKNIERSRLSIKLRFKVREDIDPLVNGAMMGNTRHKDDDGWYHYQLSGTLGKTRFRPSPAAARKGKKRKPSKRPTSISSSDDDSEDDSQLESSGTNGRIQRSSISSRDRKNQDAQRDQLREERARRRQERKEKREEMMRKRRERQDELKQENDVGMATDNEAFAIPDDIILNGPAHQADEEELESDEEGGEEEEGENEAESEEEYEEE